MGYEENANYRHDANVAPESNVPVRKDACSDLSWEKLAGVGLVGAIGSVLLFVTYTQLSADTKRALREAFTSAIKAQIARYTGK